MRHHSLIVPQVIRLSPNCRDIGVLNVPFMFTVTFQTSKSDPQSGRRKGSPKYGRISVMKTTLDIPDKIFRRAKSQAAEQGIPLRQFVVEAIEQKLPDVPPSGKGPG